MKKIIFIFAACLSINVVLAADVYIYKFNDKNGNKIYSDRLPANEKGEFTVFSGKSGIIRKVVEREISDEEIIQRDLELSTKKENGIKEDSELQRRKDTSLIGSYTNADEIDKLKKYELDQIDLVIKTISDNLNNLKEKQNILENNKKLSPDNKNIEDESQKNIADISITEESLESHRKMRAERENKYNEDKKRYLEIIKSMGSNN